MPMLARVGQESSENEGGFVFKNVHYIYIFTFSEH